MIRDEDRVPDELETLAEALRGHGFATAGFHDGGYMSESFNIGQGFELYDDSKGKGLKAIGPKVFEWLRSNSDQDFLLFVHTYDTHTPYAPHPPFNMLFVDEVPGPTPGFVPNSEQMEAIRLSKYTDHPRKLPANDLAYAMALYDAGIRFVDDWFGELMTLVRELGLEQRATIVVISDHGEEFQEHGSVLHEKLYAPVTRVPLIIRFPGGGAGSRVDDVVQAMDLMPTLLEITGSPIPQAVQARSLVPNILGVTDRKQTVAFGESPFFGQRRFVASGDLHLLYTVADQSVELYRFRVDPLEQRNVSSLELDRAQDMLEAVLRWNTDIRIPIATVANTDRKVDPETREQLRKLGYVP
jgi:arylsulfatase A-like enzyme